MGQNVVLRFLSTTDRRRCGGTRSSQSPFAPELQQHRWPPLPPPRQVSDSTSAVGQELGRLDPGPPAFNLLDLQLRTRQNGGQNPRAAPVADRPKTTIRTSRKAPPCRRPSGCGKLLRDVLGKEAATSGSKRQPWMDRRGGGRGTETGKRQTAPDVPGQAPDFLGSQEGTEDDITNVAVPARRDRRRATVPPTTLAHPSSVQAWPCIGHGGRNQLKRTAAAAADTRSPAISSEPGSSGIVSARANAGRRP